MTLRGWLPLLLVLSCTEQPGESPPPESMPPERMSFGGDQCEEPAQVDIPERECSGELLECQPLDGCTDSCPGDCDARALSEELFQRLAACELGCGWGIQVAVRDGCVTTVHGYAGTQRGDCMREQLIGTRWSCGDVERLVSVIDVCDP